MERKKRYLRGLESIVPDKALEDRIFHLIEKKQRRKEAIQIWGYRSVAAVSLCALYPTASVLYADATASGFFSYLGLLVTDGVEIFTSVGSGFALVLIESMPVISMVGVLVVLVVFAFAFRGLLAGSVVSNRQAY